MRTFRNLRGGHRCAASVVVAVGLVAASVLAALPAGAVEHPDPRRLPRGADTSVVHLQDAVIRVGGRQTRVQVRADAERMQLLGKAGKDHLVASGLDGDVSVHRIRSGEPPRLVPRGRSVYNGTRSLGVFLARGGKRLVWSEWNRGGAVTTVRSVATGRAHDSEAPGGYGVPYDARGTTLLIRGLTADERTATVLWRTAGAGGDRVGGPDVRVVTQRELSGGFIDRDLIFVQTSRGRFGPTSLATPATPPWSARFTPIDLAPNGTRVLGVATATWGGRAVLQLRRMSDGVVLRSWTYGAPRAERDTSGVEEEWTARFESNAKVVFEVRRGGKSALVRCGAKGQCRRASVLGGPISFSHEPFLWAPWMEWWL